MNDFDRFFKNILSFFASTNYIIPKKLLKIFILIIWKRCALIPAPPPLFFRRRICSDESAFWPLGIIDSLINQLNSVLFINYGYFSVKLPKFGIRLTDLAEQLAIKNGITMRIFQHFFYIFSYEEKQFLKIFLAGKYYPKNIS